MSYNCEQKIRVLETRLNEVALEGGKWIGKYSELESQFDDFKKKVAWLLREMHGVPIRQMDCDVDTDEIDAMWDEIMSICTGDEELIPEKTE